MARRKYQARVCENDVCKDVGKSTPSLDAAIKRMRKGVEKMRKRSFKKSRKTEPFTAVHGEVVEKERGRTVDGPPIYASGYGEGNPQVGHPRRRRSRNTSDEQ